MRRAIIGIGVTACFLFSSAALLAQSRLARPVMKPDPREAQYREHFAKQERHLYGIGIIWAKWLHGDDESHWAWDGKVMDKIVEAGGTSCPLNLPWIDVEPERGQWNFEYTDHIVNEASKRGLAGYAYMGLTPDWALPPEAPQGIPGIGYRFPPPDSYKEEFIAYCKNIARRYKGRVKYYQFWNEPNGCSWVKDGCGNMDGYELYTKWLKIWYTAMKEEDPDCVLGAGALDYHAGVTTGYEFLEGMYKVGAKGYFDAFNIHPYDGKGTLHIEAIEDTRRVMVEHGDGDKGIWISEWGWSMTDEVVRSRRIWITLATLENPRYYYVTMANYLSLTDPAGEPGYGICNPDLTPRDSYLTFKKFAQESRMRGEEKRPRKTR